MTLAQSSRPVDSDSPAPQGLLLWSLDVFDREIQHFLDGIEAWYREEMEGVEEHYARILI